MQEVVLELGESVFGHRKSNIRLTTQTSCTVSCKDEDEYSYHAADAGADADTSPLRFIPQSHDLWIPRARTFVLSLHISFAADLDLYSITSQYLYESIAVFVQNAELWKQLGYEASYTQPTEGRDDRVLDMDFTLRVWAPRIVGLSLIRHQSRGDHGFPAVCPEGVCQRSLNSVRLRLYFAAGVRTNEDVRQSSSMHKQRGLPNPEFRDLQHQFDRDLFVNSVVRRVIPAESSQSSSRAKQDVSLKRQTRARPRLDSAVMFALLDAGFRSSICTRPARVAAGIRYLAEQDAASLSDLAPATFVPTYAHNLEDQTKFIPEISRWLANFVTSSSSDELESARGAFPSGSEKISGRNGPALGLYRDLWMTAANGPRSHGAARRLQPLWLSKSVNNIDPSVDAAEFSDLQVASDKAAATWDTFGLWSSDTPDDGEIDGKDQDLFDFKIQLRVQANMSHQYICPVTLEGITGYMNPTAGNVSDVEIRGGGQTPGNINGLSLGREIASSLGGEDRDHSDSLPPLSDVSLLMDRDEPMDGACMIGQHGAIGGPAWLTQDIIRMHPLMQQHQEVNEAGLRFPPTEKCSLYQRPDHGHSDGAQSSGVTVERASSRYTKQQPPSIFSSPSTTSDPDLIQDPLHSHYDDHWDDYIRDTTTSMSTNLKKTDSDTSLADVLGNDHLLWHMWKRRASVAPRGEEDIIDMKMMYETDPDMKLLSGSWDLDPSDISSGSNEDPMLQETMATRSPRRETSGQQATPSSERRSSYFPPTRSSSSSSYVGRSQSDPKRRSSLIKRLTWGGRNSIAEGSPPDVSKPDSRTMEVKRRKTLDDYEMMDREENEDDSNDMLF